MPMTKAKNSLLIINVIDNIPEQTKPDTTLITAWAQHAWQSLDLNTETTTAINIALIDETESQALNTSFRHQAKPTNVLSFPADDLFFDEEATIPLLGELALCATIINSEAKNSHSPEAHWAHMITHGLLHLLDYSHDNHHDAEIMESVEIKILAELAFPNPYQDKDPS